MATITVDLVYILLKSGFPDSAFDAREKAVEHCTNALRAVRFEGNQSDPLATIYVWVDGDEGAPTWSIRPMVRI